MVRTKSTNKMTNKKMNKKMNKTRRNIGGGPDDKRGKRSRSRSRSRSVEIKRQKSTIVQDAKNYIDSIGRKKRMTDEEKTIDVVITLLDEDHNVFNIMKNRANNEKDKDKTEKLESLFNDGPSDNEDKIKPIIKDLYDNSNLFEIVKHFYDQELSDHKKAENDKKHSIYTSREAEYIKKNIVYLKYIVGE